MFYGFIVNFIYKNTAMEKKLQMSKVCPWNEEEIKTKNKSNKKKDRLRVLT